MENSRKVNVANDLTRNMKGEFSTSLSRMLDLIGIRKKSRRCSLVKASVMRLRWEMFSEAEENRDKEKTREKIG